tara:strand:- start:857 stop:1555 length:699 start_codon:yes stop_codon:yes gene_type:complete
MKEKYLKALKSLDGFVIVSVWAERFGEMFPDDLEKANKEAEGQNAKKETGFTTGIREIAARISSNIHGGVWHDQIEIDNSERPRMVRYIEENELQLINQKNLNEDIEPLKRDDIIRNAKNNLETKQLYRLTQFEQITKELNKWFGTRFEVEHSKALLNQHDQGKHHPDNIQILLKSHNSKKNNKNWERFTLEKQIEYINKVIELQKLVLENFNLEFEQVILEDLIDRLKRIY